MATIGYRPTKHTEAMMDEIVRYVNASGSCIATANALHAGQMFEPLEMTALDMARCVTELLNGRPNVGLPDLPRTEKDALEQEAAKRGLTVEFQPYTMIFKRGGA